MPGWLTDDVPLGTLFTGNEVAPFDTYLASGQNPQTVGFNTLQLALMLNYLSNNVDVTPVNGTRYYVNSFFGAPFATPTTTIGTNIFPTLNTGTQIATGIQYLIGGTGGTDKIIVELHDSTGLLVATSATAGTNVGSTANLWQQVPFTATYTLTGQQYYIAVQLNGTTARFKAFNSPSMPALVTGSATGTFGTGASITVPTTYTAGLGPIATLY